MENSREETIERIAEDLTFAFPMLIRRILREETHPGMRRSDPSRFVLVVIKRHGPMSISEIGRVMQASKPHMTALVDRLIQKGFVRRIPDDVDRRRVMVALTEKGREFLREFRDRAREAMMAKISALDSKDIAALSESMEEFRRIMSKLETKQGAPGGERTTLRRERVHGKERSEEE